MRKGGEEMKKRLKTFLAATFVLTIVLGTQVMASMLRSTYYLPKNTEISIVDIKARDIDYFKYHLYNVYPPGNKIDTYTRIKLALVDRYGHVVLSTRVISESISDITIATQRDLKKNDYVIVEIRGNDPTLDAYADIAWDCY